MGARGIEQVNCPNLRRECRGCHGYGMSGNIPEWAMKRAYHDPYTGDGVTDDVCRWNGCNGAGYHESCNRENTDLGINDKGCAECGVYDTPCKIYQRRADQTPEQKTLLLQGIRV